MQAYFQGSRGGAPNGVPLVTTPDACRAPPSCAATGPIDAVRVVSIRERVCAHLVPFCPFTLPGPGHPSVPDIMRPCSVSMRHGEGDLGYIEPTQTKTGQRIHGTHACCGARRVVELDAPRWVCELGTQFRGPPVSPPGALRQDPSRVSPLGTLPASEGFLDVFREVDKVLNEAEEALGWILTGRF